MSPEIVRQSLEAQPFVPFHIAMTDHSDYSVEAREEAGLVGDGTALMISKKGLRVVISLNQIVSISFDSPGEKPFGFGGRSRADQ